MKLEDHTKRLIAVGASVAANCQPCLQINVGKALEEGIDGEQIDQAIQVGRLVRQGAASKMDRFAASLNQISALEAEPAEKECGCTD